MDFHLGSRNFNLTFKAEFSFVRLGSPIKLQTLSSIPFLLIKLISIIWTRIDFDLWEVLFDEESMFPLSFSTTSNPSECQWLVIEDDNLGALCW